MKIVVSVILLIIVATMVAPVVEAQHRRNAVVNPTIQPVMPVAPQPVIQPFVQSPIQPFMQSPIQPFGVAPIRTPPLATTPIFTAPAVLPSDRFSHPGRGFHRGVRDFSGFGVFSDGTFGGGSNVTIFEPGGTVVAQDPSGERVAPGFTPRAAIVEPPPAVHVVRPDRPEVQLPPVGTSRDQVLQQFGSPAASVITRDGETLVFNGGVTIFLQNGQVAGPR